MKKRILLSVFAVFLMASSATAQVPGYVPTSNLKGWWGFNGNANDESTNGNNFTNSGATLTTDRFGNVNEAYNFSGTSQSMTVNSPSFTFGPSSTFTVSLWIYKPSLSYGVALMNSSGVSGNFVWNVQTSSAGNYQFGANKQGGTWAWAQSTYVINQWYHVVATFNNGAMTLYENGVQVVTQTFTQTTAATTNLPLYLGKGHAGNYYTGKIDDLGIWDRVLTQAEITSLYVGCNVGAAGNPINASAIIGASASFGTASTNSAVTYQWQSNSSGSFQNITNGGQFSGATSDTLMVSNVTMTNNGEKFRCVLSENASCTDTTTAAMLTVCGGLVGQPSSQSVNAGSMVKFGTTSSDPTATFQWQLNAGSGYVSLTNGSQFMNTTTDTLTIAAATMSLNGKLFRCLSTSGSCLDTSDEATLTVVAIGIEDAKNILVE